MFSKAFQKIKEIIQKMLGMNQTIERTLHIVPAVSNAMTQAIDDWTAMYEDRAEWLHEPTAADPTLVASLGLPAFIASEKARMAVLELKSEITAPKETVEEDNPDYEPFGINAFGQVQGNGANKTLITEKVKGPTERAEYLNKQYQEKLLSKIRTQLEYGIAKGSLIIKPYVVRSKQSSVAGVAKADAEETFDIDFDFVQADCFYPFSFDSSGNLVEVAFIQTKVDKDKIYTRLEYHKRTRNQITIKNLAYEALASSRQDTSAFMDTTLGSEIPLDKVPEWKDIPPVATIQNVDRMMFGYFKMPDANTIDPHSPLGISGFARAKSLIEQADKQYSRLLWEFEGGELAIDIDRDALSPGIDSNGNSYEYMAHGQQRLYRTIDLGESNTYKPYSPALRDASLINGLNTILMRIEDVCALSRGTISNVVEVARTATEIVTLKQRSYSSNAEIQHSLELALRDVIYAMDVYCTLYNIVGDAPKDTSGNVNTSKIGSYDVSFSWDDSILVDVDTELQRKAMLMNMGVASKQEIRMWYFGESAKQAQDALQKIAEESQQAIERNAIFSSQMGQQLQASGAKTTQPDTEGEGVQQTQPNKTASIQNQIMQNSSKQ